MIVAVISGVCAILALAGLNGVCFLLGLGAVGSAVWLRFAPLPGVAVLLLVFTSLLVAERLLVFVEASGINSIRPVLRFVATVIGLWFAINAWRAARCAARPPSLPN